MLLFLYKMTLNSLDQEELLNFCMHRLKIVRLLVVPFGKVMADFSCCQLLNYPEDTVTNVLV
jgi:hypothetical protein